MEMLHPFLIVITALATGECYRRKHGLELPSLPQTILPEALWFDQKLDHYKPTDLCTWKQRYYVNDTFFNAKSGDAPVFLMIGGEGEASAEEMVVGSWIEYAEVFGALCFQLEHRFYGMSRPTKDMSVESLAYLNSEQALADLAYFIVSMNAQYGLGNNNKWVAFGGSYPGSLAAWLRYKYPHLVHAAISSSGPLLAIADFKEYNEVVEDSLSESSNECVTQVKLANKHLTKLFGNKSGGRLLTKKFRLCSPLDVSNKFDKANLAESMAGYINYVVQYNKNNKMTTDPISQLTIDDVCSIMTDSKLGEALDRYAELNIFIMDRNNETCQNYTYNDSVEAMRNITWSSEPAEAGRQWFYQTCVEFGFYPTSSSENELFGANYPLDFFIQQCKDIFGKGFGRKLLEQGIKRTNIMYGDLLLKVTRVLFVHGSIDPWHALGITSSRNPDAPAIFINGTAHCADMYPSGDSDLPQLKEARKVILHYIQKWLKENDY